MVVKGYSVLTIAVDGRRARSQVAVFHLELGIWVVAGASGSSPEIAGSGAIGPLGVKGQGWACS